MSAKSLFLKVGIEVNSRDSKRCSIACSYAEKKQGIYHCNLFDEGIDNGDDEENDEYDFRRTEGCLVAEIEE